MNSENKINGRNAFFKKGWNIQGEETKINSVAEKLSDWHEEHISIEEHTIWKREISDPEYSNL